MTCALVFPPVACPGVMPASPTSLASQLGSETREKMKLEWPVGGAVAHKRISGRGDMAVSVRCFHCVQSAHESCIITDGCHSLTTCPVISTTTGHFYPVSPVFTAALHGRQEGPILFILCFVFIETASLCGARLALNSQRLDCLCPPRCWD